MSHTKQESQGETRKQESARETAENGCQQVLQVERPYWRERPECGKVARFTWNSDLRGKLRLCRRHAKAVGIEHCAPVRSKE